MKKIYPNILLSVLFCFAFLQSAEAQGWWKTYDHSGGKAKTLLTTPDGGYFLHANVFLKTDADGSLQLSEYMGYVTSGSNRTVTLLDDSGYAFVTIDPWNPGYLERVRRMDEFGNFIWSAEIPLLSFEPVEAQTASIDRTIDGGLVAGFGYYDMATCDCRYYTLHKFDLEGQLLWSVASSDTLYRSLYSLKTLSDGGFALAGQIGSGIGQEAFVEKRDSNGNVLWEKNWPNISRFRSVIEASDGTILVTGDNLINSDTFTLVKISQNGDEIWSQEFGLGEVAVIQDLKEVPSGGFVMVGRAGNTNGLIFRADADGAELWRRIYDSDDYEEFFRSVQALPNGDFAVCGEQGSGVNSQSLLLKTDSLGQVYTHQIFGNVFNDEALDCTFDHTEQGLLGWVVTAAGEENFYGNTDENGNFSILVDTGEYDLSISTTMLWESCQVSYPVSVPSFYDSTEVNIPLQPEFNCPMLEVDITTPFIRPCSLGYYVVNYCNLGTETAIGAIVEIELAEGLTYDGTANGNLLSQNGQMLVFGLGDVNINECSSFSFTYDTDCDLTLIGQTLCTEAHILPDTICVPFVQMPNIEVTGQCVNDSVKFEIQNVGDDMPEVFEYIIIEDNIILLQGDFQLQNGQTQEASEEAMTGSTYHLIAAQDVNFPSLLGNPVATFSIEGCVGSTNPGAINQIPIDDGDPWLSISCEEVTSSYDPNDKTPSPTGWTEEHFIEAHTDLVYRIRFQNTGTDTAFNVVIVDTLSPFLDPASIRPGAASHPYTFELSGQGVARFKFANILLPDSTTNELASNGFVNFKISQTPDNQIGTIIENTAHIYFDFNPPIATNTVFHAIGEPWVILVEGSVQTTEPHHQIKVNVFPNPYFTEATFKLEGFDQNGTLEIFDLTGRRVLSQNFSAGQAKVNRKNLTSGVYIFRMNNEAGVLASGKLMVR